jgi:20S proteasome subunit beta 7
VVPDVTTCSNWKLPLACIAAGSYGSTKRYKSLQRIFKVNDNCIVGASGEVSDFQEIQNYLEDLEREDYIADDGITLTPREIHAYLCTVMYNRRNK